MENINANKMFISSDLLSMQDLLEYLDDILKKQEVSMLLFEIEYLDRWFSIYLPDVVYRATSNVLHMINDISPEHAKIFQISNSIYSIIFIDSNIDEIIEFAHTLPVLVTQSKNDDNLNVLDFALSIGIARGGTKSLIPKAFSALKSAKKSVCRIFFLDIGDDEFQKYQNDNIKLNKLVKSAIYTGNIVTFYQPIYDNRLHKITKYECLSRLIDNGRILRPFDFLHIARQMGFMRSITYSVIDNSFKLFKDNDFDFSINITEEDIRDTRMIEYISDICEKYHITPSRIIIELLEDIEFSDDNLVVNNIMMLKNMGFKIAIDDFGYANSNFGRLIKMQIDYVKIDGRFIKNMDTNPVSYKIVKAISSFAKTVDVQCIAEYVHSKSIQSLVTSFGIEFSQGHHIGEAISGLYH